MSFYRILFAATAAIAIASPLFADKTVGTQNVTNAATSVTALQPAAAETKININKASAKDLLKIKGLNASKARAIISYRKKHGEFKSLDDLVHIKSIAKLNAEELKTIRDQMSLS